MGEAVTDDCHVTSPLICITTPDRASSRFPSTRASASIRFFRLLSLLPTVFINSSFSSSSSSTGKQACINLIMSGLLGNPAVTNLMFSLGAMQVARKVPTDDPEVLFYLRIAYVAIQLITLGGYFYMTSKAKAKNDTSILKYVQPGNPMSGGEGELVTTTVRDYDVSEISKLMRGVYIGCAIMCFLHGYMKYTQPLFIQSIMTLKGLYDSKPAKIYLLGQPATGDLKRPWLAAAPGAGLFGAAPGGTDAATIKEAEQDAKKTK